jgi:hypothetical protein
VAAEGFIAHSSLRIENGETVRSGIQGAQMTDCGSEAKTNSPAQRRVLSIRSGFKCDYVRGWHGCWADWSMELIADSLDMFADAVAYGIALSDSTRAPPLTRGRQWQAAECCWYLVSAFY